MGIRRETEASFQRTVIELARLHGWEHYHTHDARRSPAGFPDLVLVRERVVYAELKTDAGKVRPDQERWLGLLRAAGQEAYLWRPKDWGAIVKVLSGEG